MSDVLVSEEVRVSVDDVPKPGPRPQSTALERTKSALGQLDENLRLRPLPTVALALALGFVAARMAVAISAR